jgi:peptidoglycan/LPS O-acetylase OafA/YrhL
VILDLIGGTAVIAYMVYLLIGIRRDKRATSLPDMDRAIAAFMLAALAAFISAATALMRVDEHGWGPVGFAGFFLVGSVVIVCLAVGRADRMEDAR